MEEFKVTVPARPVRPGEVFPVGVDLRQPMPGTVVCLLPSSDYLLASGVPSIEFAADVGHYDFTLRTVGEPDSLVIQVKAITPDGRELTGKTNIEVKKLLR